MNSYINKKFNQLKYIFDLKLHLTNFIINFLLCFSAFLKKNDIKYHYRIKKWIVVLKFLKKENLVLDYLADQFEYYLKVFVDSSILIIILFGFIIVTPTLISTIIKEGTNLLDNYLVLNMILMFFLWRIVVFMVNRNQKNKKK